MDNVYGWKTSIDYDFWKDWNSVKTVTNPFTVSKYGVKDKEGNYTVKLALPGVEKEDLDLTVENNKLTITLEKNHEFVSAFTHVIELQEYNEDSIKTSLVNGVLEITLEKKAELKPKKLKI